MVSLRNLHSFCGVSDGQSDALLASGGGIWRRLFRKPPFLRPPKGVDSNAEEPVACVLNVALRPWLTRIDARPRRHR
jgi:hypothetical protein